MHKKRRIRDLKIDVISFVDSAANKRKFAIFKNKNQGVTMDYDLFTDPNLDDEFKQFVIEIKKGEQDRAAVAKKVKALMNDPSDESLHKAFRLIDAFMMSKMLEADLNSMISKSLETSKETLSKDDLKEEDIEKMLEGFEAEIDKQKKNPNVDLASKVVELLGDPTDKNVKEALSTAKKLLSALKAFSQKYPYPAKKENEPVKKVTKNDKDEIEIEGEDLLDGIGAEIIEIKKKGAKLSNVTKGKLEAALKAIQDVLEEAEPIEKKVTFEDLSAEDKADILNIVKEEIENPKV